MVGGGSAKAGTALPEDFFDFDWAVQVWSTVRSHEEMLVLFEDECPEAVYAEWEGVSQNSLAGLDGHPQAEALKRCGDLEKIFDQWETIYKMWFNNLQAFGSDGWNTMPGNLNCMMIAQMNIFTGDCNDIPDWRWPEDVAEDNELIAAKKARKKKNSN